MKRKTASINQNKPALGAQQLATRSEHRFPPPKHPRRLHDNPQTHTSPHRPNPTPDHTPLIRTEPQIRKRIQTPAYQIPCSKPGHAPEPVFWEISHCAEDYGGGEEWQVFESVLVAGFGTFV